MGCCSGIAKTLLIILNIVFLLVGVTCLALGIWALLDTQQTYLGYLTKFSSNVTSVNVPSLLQSAAIVLIVTGAVILFIAICGCIGACKEVKCFLVIYVTIVAIIMCVQVAAIVLAAVFSAKVETTIKTYLEKTLNEAYKGPYLTSEPVSLAWDYVMVKFSCCGLNNGTDFSMNATLWNNTYVNPENSTTHTAQIPLTCCKFTNPTALLTNVQVFMESMEDKTCPYTMGKSNAGVGCYNALKTKSKTYANILLGIGCGVLVVEVLCVIFAVCVMNAMKKDK